MQAELKNEQEHGLHSFTGILSRVEPARAFSLVVPLESDTDFTLHQYELAAPLMFDRIHFRCASSQTKDVVPVPARSSPPLPSCWTPLFPASALRFRAATFMTRRKTL